MRKRTFWQRSQSNNEREGLGYLRYLALRRQYDYGQRRNYRHSDFDGSRRWNRAMELISPRRKRVLRRTDPRGFYRSPAVYKTQAEH